MLWTVDASVEATAFVAVIDGTTGDVLWAKNLDFGDPAASGVRAAAGPGSTVWLSTPTTGVTVLDDDGNLLFGTPID